MFRSGVLRFLVLSVGVTTQAWGSTSDLLGSGARSQAMAASGAAHLTGPSASYANPARLSAEPRNRFTFGVNATRFALELRDKNSPQTDNSNDATQAATFGLTLPLPLGERVSDRLVLGLALSTPGSTLVRVRILDPARAQFPLLAPRADTLNFNPGLGVRLPYGLSVGVGSMILASLYGAIDINAGASGSVSSVTDDELVLVQAPIVGLNWQASRELSLALVARGELRSEFDLKVRVQDLGNIVVPPLNISGLAQADPAQLQTELAYRFGPWLFATGGTFKHWSSFDQFKDATVSCPADEPDCSAPPATRFTMSNTLTPRLAAAYRVEITPTAVSEFRAGYFYEPSPLPIQRGPTQLFDSDRHAVTLGYGIALTSPWPLAVDFAVQHHSLAERQHTRGVATSGSLLSYALEAEVGF